MNGKNKIRLKNLWTFDWSESILNFQKTCNASLNWKSKIKIPDDKMIMKVFYSEAMFSLISES